MNYGTKTSEIDWTAVVARAAQYARRVEILEMDEDGQLQLVDTCSAGEFVDANKETLSIEEIATLCTMRVGARMSFGGGAAPIFEVVAL